MIEIFDCATHPTINSNWLSEKYDGLASFDLLILNMRKNGIKRAFAIGMKNIGNYNETEFINLTNKYKDILYPVAYFDYFDFSNIDDLKSYLKKLVNLGFIGIKIHPRFSNINFSNKNLELIIKEANKIGLLTFICTYFSDEKLNLRNNLIELMTLLSKVKDEKIILLHSGVINLLELVTMAKIYQNVLFDLSYTICKFKESSLDLDIKFLFNNFDKRICIGSDHPEVELKDLRERFEYFAKNLSKEKLENIAYKNLENFMKGI